METTDESTVDLDFRPCVRAQTQTRATQIRLGLHTLHPVPRGHRPLRSAAKAIGHQVFGYHVQALRDARIVNIQHGGAQTRLTQDCELGRNIGRLRPVIVQMVTPDIGDHGNIGRKFS